MTENISQAETLDELAKACSKFIHFERVWRLTEDPQASGQMTHWRERMSSIVSDYDRTSLAS